MKKIKRPPHKPKPVDILKPVKQLWWLSFAGKEGNRGVALVMAADMFEAHFEVTKRKLNPGGEVMGWPIKQSEELKPYINKLVDTKTARKLLGAVKLKDEIDVIGEVGKEKAE